MLRGHLDRVSRLFISGWVQDTNRPDDPVSLLITCDDRFIARVLANGYRRDLEAAKIGKGRHSYEVALSPPMSLSERHVVRIRGEMDGVDVPGSPVTIEPAQKFANEERQFLAGLLRKLGGESELMQALDFLTAEGETLKQRLAALQSRREERVEQQLALRRQRRNLPGSDATRQSVEGQDLLRRALFIDEQIPRPDRDAGSNAIMAHMQSLQRLGYEVGFVAARQFAADGAAAAALEAIGMKCYGPPLYGCVEDVLRRQSGGFDLLYLHRVSSASKYLALGRHYCPKARVIYSVADLHHVRFDRQAVAEDRPELAALGKRIRMLECVATASADAVITHSQVEADVLRNAVRGANVHVVPWSATVASTAVAFADRTGLAFIGSFTHQPNQDAARWLIAEIMPLVRQHSPAIECLLVGSEMPESLSRLSQAGIIAVGHVDSLTGIFDRVRLTVAPLNYGAGIKGKVLDSLAAGIPCVCTPVAAEGLELPGALRACVAGDAQGIAQQIRRLHDDAAWNETCRNAGLDYIAASFSPARVDTLMSKVIAQ
jgi:O-antigen biosynthesis protein